MDTEGITSSAYKTMFAEYALQRSRFASQLANLVIEYGGEPGDARTVITQQYQQIVEAHDRIYNLCEVYRLEHKN